MNADSSVLRDHIDGLREFRTSGWQFCKIRQDDFEKFLRILLDRSRRVPEVAARLA